MEGLTSFDMGGSASFLSAAQEDALKVFVSATLPRSTRHVGAWIEQEFARSERDLEWEATRHDQMARWLLCKEVFDFDLCLVHAHFRIG